MEITYIIIALVVVYFFGGAIKAVLGGIGDMSANEFEYHKDLQEFRIAKEYDKLGKKLEETELTHGKASVRAKLKAVQGSLEEA